MENKEISDRARKLCEQLSPEQKLGQIVGMFGGAQIPPEILFRFPNGLGEVSFIPGEAGKEENYECDKGLYPEYVKNIL